MIIERLVRWGACTAGPCRVMVSRDRYSGRRAKSILNVNDIKEGSDSKTAKVWWRL
jgi:hypothetical protein